MSEQRKDEVFETFMEHGQRQLMALAAESDLFDVQAMPGMPSQRFLIEFRCKGLVRARGGEVQEADHFVVGLWVPSEYLRRVIGPEILTWLEPHTIFHPNLKPPLVCLGPISPATPLTSLIYRCYEVITYQRCTMREDDALNWEACRWARGHQDRFPIDRRPLKWRAGCQA